MAWHGNISEFVVGTTPAVAAAAVASRVVCGRELAAAIRTNTSLRVLHLAYNELTDETGRELAAAIRTNTSLRVLDLANNKLPMLTTTAPCGESSRCHFFLKFRWGSGRGSGKRAVALGAPFIQQPADAAASADAASPRLSQRHDEQVPAELVESKPALDTAPLMLVMRINGN